MRTSTQHHHPEGHIGVLRNKVRRLGELWRIGLVAVLATLTFGALMIPAAGADLVGRDAEVVQDRIKVPGSDELSALAINLDDGRWFAVDDGNPNGAVLYEMVDDGGFRNRSVAVPAEPGSLPFPLDPEGIEWMHDNYFAVLGEGSGGSDPSLSVIEIVTAGDRTTRKVLSTTFLSDAEVENEAGQAAPIRNFEDGLEGLAGSYNASPDDESWDFLAVHETERTVHRIVLTDPLNAPEATTTFVGFLETGTGDTRQTDASDIFIGLDEDEMFVLSDESNNIVRYQFPGQDSNVFEVTEDVLSFTDENAFCQPEGAEFFLNDTGDGALLAVVGERGRSDSPGTDCGTGNNSELAIWTQPFAFHGTLLPDVVPDPTPPAAPEPSASITADSTTCWPARLISTVTNTGTEAETFTVEYAQPGSDSYHEIPVALNAGESKTVTYRWSSANKIPMGPTKASVTLDGVELGFDRFWIGCSQKSTSVPSETVQSWIACSRGNGVLRADVANFGTSDVQTTAKFTKVPSSIAPVVRNTNVAGDSFERLSVSGRSDGVYEIEVIQNGQTVYSATEVVACDHPSIHVGQDVAVWAQCYVDHAGRNRAVVRVTAKADESSLRTFLVQPLGRFNSLTGTAGEWYTLGLSNVPDGTYDFISNEPGPAGGILSVSADINCG